MKQTTRLFWAVSIAATVALVGCKKSSTPTPPTKRAKSRTKAKPSSRPVKQTTAPKGIQGKQVTYKAGDTTLKGYIAYDASKKGKRPGVLVVHEWWGHNAYARKRARMLAKLGYVALALDMFGDGKHTQHPKDAKKFAMGIYKNLKVGEERFLAAKKELEAHPMVDTKKLAAIGYCFGGGIVLHMARTGVKLAGVASFHGGLKANHKAKKGDIKADILVLNGAADPMVPAKDIKAFHKEMKRLGAKFKFINYPDALHAFTNPEATAKGKQFKLPVAYNKKADEQSWTELQAFFKRIF